MWEELAPGFGRPQEAINDELAACDYVVLMLHDRLGTPTAPSREPYFDSGTLEEYGVAIQCLEDDALPLRDILVLFKGLSEERLKDPGPSLARVIEFKDRLEQEQRLLCRTFDTIPDLEQTITRYLSSWMRDIEMENGRNISDESLPTISIEEDRTLVNQVRTGQAELEANLARRTSHEDLEGYLENLRALGRHERVVLEVDGLLATGPVSADSDLLARICVLAGQAKRRLGALEKSLDYLDRAKEYAGPSAEGRSLPVVLEHRGLTLRRLGRLDEAIAELQRSVDLSQSRGDHDTAGTVMTHLALTHRDRNELDRAESLLRAATSILERSGVPHHQSLSLSSLGTVCLDQNRTSEGLELLNRAASINTRHQDSYGLAIVLGQRARAHLVSGQLDDAQADAQLCLVLNELFNSQEGMATGSLLLGQVMLARGRTDGIASSYLLQATTVSTDIHHQFLELISKTDLALAYIQEDRELDGANLYGACLRLALVSQVALGRRYVESKRGKFPW